MIQCDSCKKAFCQTKKCTETYQDLLTAIAQIPHTLWTCSDLCYKNATKEAQSTENAHKTKKDYQQARQKLDIEINQNSELHKTIKNLEAAARQLNLNAQKEKEDNEKLNEQITALKAASAQKISDIREELNLFRTNASRELELHQETLRKSSKRTEALELAIETYKENYIPKSCKQAAQTPSKVPPFQQQPYLTPTTLQDQGPAQKPSPDKTPTTNHQSTIDTPGTGIATPPPLEPHVVDLTIVSPAEASTEPTIPGNPPQVQLDAVLHTQDTPRTTSNFQPATPKPHHPP